jgi:putative sigma-54 modulation protein
MNLTISGHHLDVTPALREYVLTKLDRVTRHFDQVVDISVLLTVEKLKEKERRQKAEVTLHVKGKDIFVEQSHEDLYAAIDQLMDKLDRQVVQAQGPPAGPPPCLPEAPGGGAPEISVQTLTSGPCGGRFFTSAGHRAFRTAANAQHTPALAGRPSICGAGRLP